MKKPLWEFSDNLGSFISETACRINSLYFPLCNHYPIMSSISPDLHGDIKTGYNAFLLEPASRISLLNSKSSRNFWIYLNPKKIWSITGVSKIPTPANQDKFKLEAGLLWHKITRQNTKLGLDASITSFVPATGEPLEIMYVEITNISSRIIKFTPTAAIPLFARSANNLHDHRHVTSLLNRTQINKYGITVTPTLSFEESGHKKNLTAYFVYGLCPDGSGPRNIYPTQEEFTGSDSDLEMPKTVFNNLPPDKKLNPQGKEAMAGLKFKAQTLKPKTSCSYIILMGIADSKKDTPKLLERFNSPGKIIKSLNLTKSYWQNKCREISVSTADNNFDNWFNWVNIQPALRKIFGCSFLPDFDYGKGGRGWRDLWQDCLSLILTSPGEVHSLLINNFKGVRIDGSNATIIGQLPGEFIADRNNISRVWMDHGIWPLVTIALYIHQTRDFAILDEKTSYFRDHQLCRGREKDWDWKPEYGKELKTTANQIYQGSLLEHILIQNLVQFFNVGAHNLIRLEGADWNDGLDMASEFGESVAFTAMYAQNLNTLCEILQNSEADKFEILKEITILLDTLNSTPIDYSDAKQKQNVLEAYFHAAKVEVSGERIILEKNNLISDLKKKSNWITEYIRKHEWLNEGFFNGYYDNQKNKVEGKINGSMRMTLTGQVFPIMSGIATNGQINILFKNSKKYLKDKKLGGWRLNTDFKTEQLNLGRAFSFVYGDKENGAFFNHMSIMFAYSLYLRGFVKEGFEVLDSIYQMARNTKVSNIYPCLPEYFNSQGQGMYSYLTGSASWFILTMLTQVFGIKGYYGDLRIEPKLTSSQFKPKDAISLSVNFGERKIKVNFINKRARDFGSYSIVKVTFNEKVIAQNISASYFTFKRSEFLSLADRPVNTIELFLD